MCAWTIVQVLPHPALPEDHQAQATGPGQWGFQTLPIHRAEVQFLSKFKYVPPSYRKYGFFTVTSAWKHYYSL